MSVGITITHFLVCVFLNFLDFHEIMFMEIFFFNTYNKIVSNLGDLRCQARELGLYLLG